MACSYIERLGSVTTTKGGVGAMSLRESLLHYLDPASARLAASREDRNARGHPAWYPVTTRATMLAILRVCFVLGFCWLEFLPVIHIYQFHSPAAPQLHPVAAGLPRLVLFEECKSHRRDLVEEGFADQSLVSVSPFFWLARKKTGVRINVCVVLEHAREDIDTVAMRVSAATR
jgi:hypothetical protein